MSDVETPPEPAKARRGRFQVGLRVLFWLTAAFAVWITVSINRRENERLTAKIESLRSLVRELVVDDPAQFAVVKLIDTWSDENRWDVYLPPGQYRVCFASKDIDVNGLPEKFWSAPIEAGRHRLGMDLEAVKSGTRIRVTRDGGQCFTVDEPSNWAGNGWSSVGDFSTSQQLPASPSLMLHRRRNFHQNLPPTGPDNGLLLWIERTDGPNQAPAK
jgi:hypothetical protein